MVAEAYWEFVRRSRLAPLMCSLLVFWTGIDSQFFQLIAAETLRGPIPYSLSSLDDSDDDEMIDLAGSTRTFQTTRKERQPLPQIFLKRTLSALSLFQLPLLPTFLEDTSGRSGNTKTPLRC